MSGGNKQKLKELKIVLNNNVFQGFIDREK